jgi:hypothetical protein
MRGYGCDNIILYGVVVVVVVVVVDEKKWR